MKIREASERGVKKKEKKREQQQLQQHPRMATHLAK